MNRSPLRAFLLIPLVLACFALSPQARAVCQEGCLTNDNTVLGDDALLSNTGINNTAIGFETLLSNTTGVGNTATGAGALANNTTGGSNTAIGVSALLSNTIGSGNTATGAGALANNTTGDSNTVTGVNALVHNTTGFNNMATGVDALRHNTTGNSNIALGNSAGINLTTGSNNIDIANRGVTAEANTIRIGTQGTQTATFIAGISGATVPTGVAVIVDANGHLGTTTSSQRFKKAIKPMDNASEAILALRPVTFRYTKELDPDGIPQFGLVAEDVEKVNPDLVARDEQGKPYTVRYDAVNAMLLNEFLKQHRKVEEQSREINEQKTTITQLQSTITEQQESFDSSLAEQEQQIRALASGLQKVSAQIEMSRPAPKVVASQP